MEVEERIFMKSWFIHKKRGFSTRYNWNVPLFQDEIYESPHQPGSVESDRNLVNQWNEVNPHRLHGAERCQSVGGWKSYNT